MTTDLPIVTYRTVDRLPCNAVAIAETDECGHLTIFMSRSHPPDVLDHHLGAMMTAYCHLNAVETHRPTVRAG